MLIDEKWRQLTRFPPSLIKLAPAGVAFLSSPSTNVIHPLIIINNISKFSPSRGFSFFSPLFFAFSWETSRQRRDDQEGLGEEKRKKSQAS